MTTNGPKITTDMTVVMLILTARPPQTLNGKNLPQERAMALDNQVVTFQQLPHLMAPATGANPPQTGTLGDAIKTTRKMFPTIRCRPRPTLLALTMSGTTRITTNGELRLGVKTETSMALPPMANKHLLKTGRVLATVANKDMAVLWVAMAATHSTTVDNVPAALKSTRTGRAPPTITRPLAVPTITMSGPSRLTVPTSTQDGENPSTRSLQSLTTTRATPELFRPMMTSGLRTTTDTMPVMLPPAVLLPPSGASRPTCRTRIPATARVATVATPADSARAPRTTLLLAPTTPRTVESLVLTGMPGAETKI